MAKRYGRHGKVPKGRKAARKLVAIVVFVALCVGCVTAYRHLVHPKNTIDEYSVEGLDITQDYLTVSKYNRSGKSLPYVKGVVVHYTANPGSTAKNNRDYFESLSTTHKTRASSHFIIGLEGEVLQLMPLKEMSYASNNRNKDTISIECCHEDSTGKFNDATMASLTKLVKALMHTYRLESDDVIRHYDVTGKLCPKYFVEHEDAWEAFRSSLG